MFSAIVYKSTTGSCKRYAELLSARLHIPAFPLGKEYIPADTKIIFVGWLFAGKIMGYEKAEKKYDIGAVVQVGMSPASAKSEETGRKKNAISPDVPLFTRQGGFDINKLPPHFRFLMKIKNKEIAARFEGKTDLTDAQKATYKMASTGVGEPPCWCVDDIVKWCEQH